AGATEAPARAGRRTSLQRPPLGSSAEAAIRRLSRSTLPRYPLVARSLRSGPRVPEAPLKAPDKGQGGSAAYSPAASLRGAAPPPWTALKVSTRGPLLTERPTSQGGSAASSPSAASLRGAAPPPWTPLGREAARGRTA